MRRSRLVLAAAFAAVLAACGRSPTSVQSAARTPTPPAAAALTPAPSKESDASDFVAKAGAGNAFELAAARLAMTRASNNDVKDFAATMLRDHGKASDDLKKAIAESGQALAPSAALASDQQQAMSDMTRAPPAGFDKAYMRVQVEAHEKALALFQDYAQNGTVTALKSFAAQTAPVVQAHLETARQIRDVLQ